MSYDRRSFAGGAVGTTVTGAVDGSTLNIDIAASTGWPTGSNGNFFVVIDRGLATEEKCEIATRTSLSLTVETGGRGADGTSAVAHSSGASIEICLTARDLDEANAHLSDTALDHHTQYLNTTRHDVTARHAFGSALGTPGAAADISTAASAGNGTAPARENHVHKIGTGAINSAGMFAAGVVDAAAIAADAVGSSEIAAAAVTATELASDAVTTAKILDANVTEAKLATDAVTADKIAASAVGTTEIADDAVTNAKLAVAYVPGTHDDSVTSGTGGDDGIAVSFGVTFAAAPVVVGTIVNPSNLDIVLNIETISTTGFTYRAAHRDAGSNFGSTLSYSVNWLAVGALA